MKPCKLALADGTLFNGACFGADGTAEGEVVFNTSMAGYQEVLTDPSYTGQIVTMTYPLIGNYGVNDEDIESHDRRVQVRGFVIKELSPLASNYRSARPLEDYLAAAGIMGICGVDTRALTRHIRLAGAMNGVMSTEILDEAELVRRASDMPSMAGQNLVPLVTTPQAYDWSEGTGREFALSRPAEHTKTYRVVAIDCGAKMNILRNLADAGCSVTVVPAATNAQEVLSYNPDGVFVSNGPGDPAAVTDTVATLASLVGKVPLFGICLGHQMLALAMGAKTYKLKFGHRGANQPVRNQATGTVEITSQNHGFAVDEESLANTGAVVTHINLNDQTVEGFAHPGEALFSVQYHPEAAPGPHDARYLFECFREMMESGRSPSAEQMLAAQKNQATLSS